MGTETTTNPEHEEVPDTTPEADDTTPATDNIDPVADEEEPLDDEPDSTEENEEALNALDREIVLTEVQMERLQGQRLLLMASPAGLDIIKGALEAQAKIKAFNADHDAKVVELTDAGWTDDEIITQLEAMQNVFDDECRVLQEQTTQQLHDLLYDTDSQIEALDHRRSELNDEFLELSGGTFGGGELTIEVLFGALGGLVSLFGDHLVAEGVPVG